MADPTTQSTGAAGTSGLVIPAETQAKFGGLIELIKGSESMNNEERQYWINILPAMTPEQVQNLENILRSEREQLAAIDAKYAKQSTDVTAIGEKIRSQKERRSEKERVVEAKEKEQEQDILQKIAAL